ncbi:MAG: hypothetical protein HC834_00760 [Rhodospirillales bacterium]|nr:hypothetical protein [Rhodospirillales bacterium]
MSRKATQRVVVMLGTCAVLAVLLAWPAGAQHQHQQQSTEQIAATIGCDPTKVSGNDLEQPKLFRADNGRLDTTMSSTR